LIFSILNQIELRLWDVKILACTGAESAGHFPFRSRFSCSSEALMESLNAFVRSASESGDGAFWFVL
jgi:hypothetical protein